jgi:hypothetical protein
MTRPMRHWSFGSLVMAAGVLLALTGASRTVTLAGGLGGAPVHLALGRISPLVLAAVFLALLELHRRQRAEVGKFGVMAASVAAAGLLIAIVGRGVEYWLHAGIELDVAPAAVLGRLAYVRGIAVFAVGLVLYGGASLRAAVLPPRAAAALAAVGAMMLGAGMAGAAGLRSPLAQLLASISEGFCWMTLGRAIARTPTIASAASSTSIFDSDAWRPLWSRGTLLSAGAVLAATVYLAGWTAGLVVLALLYVHEAGHILVPALAGVRVRHSAQVLPGFGAVALVGGASHWSSGAVACLAGPLVGGAVALVIKVVGIVDDQPAFAQAGDAALLVNALALAPFRPLDGGALTGYAGKLGYVLTAVLAALVLYRAVLLLLPALLVGGMYGAWQIARGSGDLAGAGGLAPAALYLTALAVLVGAVGLSGTAEPLLPLLTGAS